MTEISKEEKQVLSNILSSLIRRGHASILEGNFTRKFLKGKTEREIVESILKKVDKKTYDMIQPKTWRTEKLRLI